MRKKLGKAVLIFFGLMILCTFISRSAWGVLVARVETAQVKKGTLTMRIQGEGTVKAGEIGGQFLPEGQKVKKILVQKGQRVEQGQAVILLDEAYLQEQIDEASQEAEKLRLQLEQQKIQGRSQARVPETASARIALNSAEGAVGRAQKAYQEAVDQAKQFAAMPLPEEAPPEEIEQWNQTLDSLNETARGLAEQINEQAALYQQAVEQYHLAEESEKNMQQNEKTQEEINRLSVESVQLDLEQAQKKLERLQKISDGGCLVKTENAGVFLESGVSEGMITTGAELLQIAVGNFYAVGMIKNENIGRIETGDNVQVTFPGKSQPLPLAVEEMGGNPEISEKEGVQPKIDAVWKTCLTDESIALGTVFSYQIEKKSELYEQLVPLSALRETKGKTYVLGVEEREMVLGKQDTAVAIPVTVVEKDSEWAAVNGVFAADTKLIVSSDKYVEEGDVIRLNE